LKIAVVSEDGVNISQHFGRAPFYVVVSVEGGKVSGKETRPKAGHREFAIQQEEEHDASGRHGYGAASNSRHATMASTIADCHVILAGGMGYGAYENFKGRGLEVVVTDVTDIEEAIKCYLEGNLSNLMGRLH